jgi:hypothetical protein
MDGMTTAERARAVGMLEFWIFHTGAATHFTSLSIGPSIFHNFLGRLHH